MSARFGDLMMRVRKKQGMTPIQLAQKTELSPAYIRLLEQNKRMPSGDTARKIIDALKEESVVLTDDSLMWGGTTFHFKRRSHRKDKVTQILSWH